MKDTGTTRPDDPARFPIGWMILWLFLALSLLDSPAKAQPLPPADARGAAIIAARVPFPFAPSRRGLRQPSSGWRWSG